MANKRSIIHVAVMLLLGIAAAFAQTANNTNVGLPPNGVFEGSGVESVQANNGNLHIEIPLVSLPGRGLSVNLSYVYDSKGWFGKPYSPVADSQIYIAPAEANFLPVAPQFWRLAGPLSNGTGVYQKKAGSFSCTRSYIDTAYTYSYQEPNGTSHSSPAVYQDGGHCKARSYTGNLLYSADGTGVAFPMPPAQSALRKDGVKLYSVSANGGTQAIMEDSNGNQITRFMGSTGGAPAASTITDTLGRSVPITFTYNAATGKYELPYSDSSGTLQNIVVTMTTVSLQTNLCPVIQPYGCTEYTGTRQMPSEIALPNGMKYSITYNQNSYGTPSSITLPTGATIYYEYGSHGEGWCQTAGATMDIDDGGPRVIKRTIVSDGQTSEWRYTYTCENASSTATAITTDPEGNDTVHALYHYPVHVTEMNVLPPFYEVETDYYAGTSANQSGKMKVVQTEYLSADRGPHLPTKITTTLISPQSSVTSRIETDWDTAANPASNPYISGQGEWFSFISWGNVVEKREYGFDGVLARRTHYNYAHLPGNANYNSNYTAQNLASLLTEAEVFDGSGIKASDTKNSYDTAAWQPAPGIINHNYAVGSYRGNRTQTSRWLDVSNTWLATDMTYDELGHMVSSTDPGNGAQRHTTTYKYEDSWEDSARCGIAGDTKAFLTETDAPVTGGYQHRSRISYHACTGLVKSTADENDILASRATRYTYDSMFRPLTISYPDQGFTSYAYGDTPGAISVTTTQKQNATKNIVTFSIHDGLGRPVESRAQDSDCADGWNHVRTQYDLLGRKSTATNPYCSGDATQVTQYSYDPLNRLTATTFPGGNAVQEIAYSGSAQKITEPPNGNSANPNNRPQRVVEYDALGRLKSVCEVSVSGETLMGTSGAPSNCGQQIAATGFLTAYDYDVLGNLKTVTQSGLAARTFVYDSLSRLTSAYNPESGTTGYTYDNDGNVTQRSRPAPNQLSQAVTVTTTYTYDELHRNKLVQYSDSTPWAEFLYDANTMWGETTENAVGRMILGYNLYSGSIRSYDSMGRINGDWQATPANIGHGKNSVTYTYDFLGEMLTSTDGAGHQFSYDYTDGRLRKVTPTIIYQGPPVLLSDARYWPSGGLKSATLGNGLTEIMSYDERLRLHSLTVGKTNCQIGGDNSTDCTERRYRIGSIGYAGNGNVLSADDSANGGLWTYAYDDFNRLKTASSIADSYNYQYDRFGNRWQQNGGVNFVVTFNNNSNRVDGYCYDAAGNLLREAACPADLGTVPYKYDAENRLISANGVAFIYDAFGRRVQKTASGTPEDYIYDLSGRVITRMNGSSWAGGEVFAGGKHLATYGSGTAYFNHSDWLGSERARTDATGTISANCKGLPFGDGQQCTGNDTSPKHFTGKERDDFGPTTPPLDYFGARYYSSTMARFVTADWAAMPVPIPYADMANPQTLNLYAYVGNNPVTATDPDGHSLIETYDFNKQVDFDAPYFRDATPSAQMAATLPNPSGFLGSYPEIAYSSFSESAQNDTPPPPPTPKPPPMAELKTDMQGHTTTLYTTDKNGTLTTTRIETRNAVAKSAKPGAADPYSTNNIVGVSNRHAGQDAYGPRGAFIDTGDSRGRAIHGGGTGLADPMAAQQGWKPTMGCTRGQNEDVIKLGNAITQFQQANPGVPIPYVRE